MNLKGIRFPIGEESSTRLRSAIENLPENTIEGFSTYYPSRVYSKRKGNNETIIIRTDLGNKLKVNFSEEIIALEASEKLTIFEYQNLRYAVYF